LSIKQRTSIKISLSMRPAAAKTDSSNVGQKQGKNCEEENTHNPGANLQIQNIKVRPTRCVAFEPETGRTI
jgi:hypothetical protein